MKRRNRTVLLLTLIAVALMGVFRAPLTQAAHRVFGGVLRLTSAVTAPLAQPSYEELLEENERLTRELAALQKATADNAVLRSENARLLRCLDLQAVNPSLTLLPASVLTANPREDGFTLDVGEELGVGVNDAVITEKGLVGRVTEVDAVSCRVTSLFSPQMRVSVRDAATADSGILVSADGELRMGLLAEDSRVAVGDLIVTSGEGGVYPENLIVGTVAAVRLDDFDASKYVAVAPAADAERVTEAAVVTDFVPRSVARDD